MFGRCVVINKSESESESESEPQLQLPHLTAQESWACCRLEDLSWEPQMQGPLAWTRVPRGQRKGKQLFSTEKPSEEGTDDHTETEAPQSIVNHGSSADHGIRLKLANTPRTRSSLSDLSTLESVAVALEKVGKCFFVCMPCLA